MHKFRLRLYIHIFNTASILLNVLLYILFNKIEQQNANYFLLLLALLAAFNFINNLVAEYALDEKSIILKSLIKKTELNWDEIECIMKQPAGKFVKESIGIFTKDKKISITPWTKGYKLLLRLVVEEVNKRKSVKVDPKVLEIIRT